MAQVTVYRFGPSEQPLFPGSPYSPVHHPARRAGYVVAMLVVGTAAQFTHALTLVNLPIVAGGLGVTLAQASWLTSVYVAVNATANLLLVRARMQYGVPWVAQGLLGLCAVATLFQLAAPTFLGALLVRAASGAASASLITMTIYYALQVVPPAARPLAILVGVSITQLATPLARLVPVDWLIVDTWQGLHLIELAVILCTMLTLALARLPPSVKEQAFERLDFATTALVVIGMVLFCGAIGAGRYLWWNDTPWIGLALCAALALFAAAFGIEHTRARPLLLTDWIGSRDILRFTVIALLIRFALAEQTYGAIGLFTLGGLNNDQLHQLFAIVFGAMAMGILVAALTFRRETVLAQIMAAAFLIAIGAWVDSSATNLFRPPQLYLSQALIGFGACLFIGPAILYGFGRVLQLGPNYLISFLVVFNFSQNLGGLLGASLLGTYQTIRVRAHAAALSEHLVASDPQVMDRLTRQGASALYGSLQREANVLAFNDVSLLIACLAAAIGVYMFKAVISQIIVDRRARS